MNYQTKQAREIMLLNLYIDYLPDCHDVQGRMKILEEIELLRQSIDWINQMPVSFSKNAVPCYYITQESKINNHE